MTLNNVTAQLFLQTTGTGTTTLNGVVDTNTGTPTDVIDYEPGSVTGPVAVTLRSENLGVDLLTTQIVVNDLINTTLGGVQLRATIGAGVGTVTLNNNGRINSDLGVILEGNASVGVQVNALGSFYFLDPPNSDMTFGGTQRQFITTSDASVEIRSNIVMTATPTWLTDRFIIDTASTAIGGAILFNGTVDVNSCDMLLDFGRQNVNFRAPSRKCND